MTIVQKLNVLAKNIVAVRRESLRTQARLKTLEAMVRCKIPKRNLSAWNVQMEKASAQYHQELLEAWEDQDPFSAAFFDDRNDDELKNLE
jgi:hypothetical protein